MATNDPNPDMPPNDIPIHGDCEGMDSVSLHVAEVVEKATPVAMKAALGTSATTVVVNAMAKAHIWTIHDISLIVGMVCSVVATTTAVTFAILNYKINKRKAGR